MGAGCIKPKITLFPDGSEPLKEYVLQGGGKEKILMISIKGFISDSQKEFSLHHRPGVLQEVAAQLRKAEKDGDIRAVILKIDSRGGSVTASDMLYHEIAAFKERRHVKVVAVIMGVAASGGYYIALPADCIVAHPTSITGSIGVIFLRPNVSGLLDKIGLTVETDKSGKNKDMGCPLSKSYPGGTANRSEADRRYGLQIPGSRRIPIAISATRQKRMFQRHASISLPMHCSSGSSIGSAISTMPFEPPPMCPDSAKTRSSWSTAALNFTMTPSTTRLP